MILVCNFVVLPAFLLDAAVLDLTFEPPLARTVPNAILCSIWEVPTNGINPHIGIVIRSALMQVFG
jgi:hypothetical protein